jgi:hypothetical protein
LPFISTSQKSKAKSEYHHNKDAVTATDDFWQYRHCYYHHQHVKEIIVGALEENRAERRDSIGQTSSFFQKRKLQDVNISHPECNHVIVAVDRWQLTMPPSMPWTLASTIAPPYQHSILSTITDGSW